MPWPALWLIPLSFLLLWLLAWTTWGRRRCAWQGQWRSPVDVLRQRLASGEISEDEFQRLRKVVAE
jgi:uncharacterized membrane protein